MKNLIGNLIFFESYAVLLFHASVRLYQLVLSTVDKILTDITRCSIRASCQLCYVPIGL